MISYEVDENAKTVKCIISGDDLKTSFFNKIQKKLKNFSMLSVNQCYIKNEYVGIARLHPDDTFSIKIGKELARKRAFLRYNRDISRSISKLSKELLKFSIELEKYGLTNYCQIRDIKKTIGSYLD